jgi:hypothetical protein
LFSNFPPNSSIVHEVDFIPECILNGDQNMIFSYQWSSNIVKTIFKLLGPSQIRCSSLSVQVQLVFSQFTNFPKLLFKQHFTWVRKKNKVYELTIIVSHISSNLKEHSSLVGYILWKDMLIIIANFIKAPTCNVIISSQKKRVSGSRV